MEEASGETNQTPKENSRDTGEVAGDQVTVGAEVNHDVDKTLYDAEEFLSNFAGLRDENEQLKQANHELQLQLEKARQDIEQLQLDKQTLEAQLLQEREQSKEELWKVRSEFQALQDERLQWKEKYLNVCMKAANPPTGLGEGSTSSGNKSKGLKRKQGSMSNLNESNSDDFYSNLSSTFGLNDQDDQQPVTVMIIKKKSHVLTADSYDIVKKTFPSSKDVFRSAALSSEQATEEYGDQSQNLSPNKKNNKCHESSSVKATSKRRTRQTAKLGGNKVDLTVTGLQNQSNHNADIKQCIIVAEAVTNNEKQEEGEDEDEEEVEIEDNENNANSQPLSVEYLTETNATNVDNSFEKIQKGDKVMYRCRACKKEVNTRTSIRRHVQTHSDVRPFVCEECGQGFKVKMYLTAHMAGKHGTNYFTCNRCGKAFSWKSTLHTHMRKCFL